MQPTDFKALVELRMEPLASPVPSERELTENPGHYFPVGDEVGRNGWRWSVTHDDGQWQAIPPDEGVPQIFPTYDALTQFVAEGCKQLQQ